MDIVVVTFNRLEYLDRCVGSLLRTKAQEDRIIIVDNASTDGTRKWLSSVERDDIHTVFLKQNVGNAEGRNRGMLCSKRDGVVLLSDNDFLYFPGWRDAALEALEADPKLALASLYNDMRISKLAPREVRPGMTLRYRNVLAHGASVVRYDAVEEIGGYEKTDKVMGFAARPFCKKLVSAGWRVAFVDTGHVLAEHMDLPSSPYNLREFYTGTGYDRFRYEAKRYRVKVGDDLGQFFGKGTDGQSEHA